MSGNTKAPLPLLIDLLRACDAEKLPGRLAVFVTRSDVRQACAYLRCEIDAIEKYLLDRAVDP